MDSQFNAIDYSQQLEAAGVPQALADVHAKMLSLAFASCAATRADLLALGAKLSDRLSSFEAKITTRMDAFEERITARMDNFDAKITARMDNFDAKMTARMDNSEAKMTARMDKFEAKTELRFARIESDIRLLRWMAATNTAILIGVLVKLYIP